jgi:hypothetical protein
MRGESNGSGKFRTVSVGDIFCLVESAVELVVVQVQIVVPIVEFVSVVESTVVLA